MKIQVSPIPSTSGVAVVSHGQKKNKRSARPRETSVADPWIDRTRTKRSATPDYLAPTVT